MKKIMSEHDGVLALFEDDVLIKQYAHYESALSQLPSDWELCYLGGNIIGEYFSICNSGLFGLIFYLPQFRSYSHFTL